MRKPKLKFKQLSNDYFIDHRPSRTKVKVNGRPLKAAGVDPKWDLFSHKERFKFSSDTGELVEAKDSHCFTISEGHCGAVVYEGEWNEPLKSVTAKALARIESFNTGGKSFEAALDFTIKLLGLSPRYEQIVAGQARKRAAAK